MGLEMYAFATFAKPSRPVDFDEEPLEDLFYWRKHPNLHGWMERLYRVKGGNNEDFNLTTVALTLEDLDRLEQAVRSDTLPHTDGFFFGVSQKEDNVRTLEFIAKAREAIADGMTVFYYSWW